MRCGTALQHSMLPSPLAALHTCPSCASVIVYTSDGMAVCSLPPALPLMLQVAMRAIVPLTAACGAAAAAAAAAAAGNYTPDLGRTPMAAKDPTLLNAAHSAGYDTLCPAAASGYLPRHAFHRNSAPLVPPPPLLLLLLLLLQATIPPTWAAPLWQPRTPHCSMLPRVQAMK